MVRLPNAKVREESLRQELLQEQHDRSPEIQQEVDWPSRDVDQNRPDSSVKVFVPTAAR